MHVCRAAGNAEGPGRDLAQGSSRIKLTGGTRLFRAATPVGDARALARGDYGIITMPPFMATPWPVMYAASELAR